MIDEQNAKYVSIYGSGDTVASNNTSYVAVDTLGFGRATFMVTLGASAAATVVNGLVYLNVGEATDSTGPFTAIEGARGATATGASVDFTLGTNVNDEIYVVNVNTAGRQRYLGLNVASALNATNTTDLAAVCILHNPVVGPHSTTADAQAKVFVNV